MAKKKTTPKKSINQILPQLKKLKKKDIQLFKKVAIVVLAGIAVFLMANRFKSQFIVATVNRRVVSRWSLNKTLVETYGAQTLDELINKALLKDLAKENDVVVADEDIQAEVDELIASLGGEEAFNQALEQYQITTEELKERISISLIQEKLAEKVAEISVTDEQIKAYFDENQTLFDGQVFADVENDIRDMIYQQELQSTFNTWFQTQKDQAAVKSFI